MKNRSCRIFQKIFRIKGKANAGKTILNEILDKALEVSSQRKKNLPQRRRI
jgi:hypothetical protein